MQASFLLTSRMVTPNDAIKSTALVWVRSVVPNPGIVADNSFTIPTQFIECFHTNQQCQCGIQTTDMPTALLALVCSKRCANPDTCMENVLTTLVQRCSLRTKTDGIENTGQIQIFGIDIFRRDTHRHFRCTIGATGCKCSVHPAFRTYMLHVNLTDNDLFLEPRNARCLPATYRSRKLIRYLQTPRL